MTVCYSEGSQYVGLISALLWTVVMLERDVRKAYPNRLLL